MHGDIGGNNVLVSDDLHAQVMDFGLSKLYRITDTSDGLVGYGTMQFKSPELWDNPKKNLASDVYAFGMLIAAVCLVVSVLFMQH